MLEQHSNELRILLRIIDMFIPHSVHIDTDFPQIGQYWLFLKRQPGTTFFSCRRSRDNVLKMIV